MKNKLDAIPLTAISDTTSAVESIQTFEEINIETQQGEVSKKIGGRRSLRVNSTYITSQKNRLSRYKTALASFVPFRRQTSVQNNEIPVDSVGCFQNLSFVWVRDYLILYQGENMKKSEVPVTFPISDSADVNGKRLLSIYKDEKQTHGKHGSMMKIIWNFCKTRVIVASFFWTLSTIFSLLAPAVFLKMNLDVLKAESESKNSTLTNNTENQIFLFKLFQFQLSFYARSECVIYMIAFIACFFASKLFHNITLWLNLRTSIRLRSGVLAVTYRKAMKSSVLNNIAPHQILTDDIDNLMELVNHLSKIVGTIIAVILSLVASIVLLKGPGVWPVFASIGFFCIPIVLAKISTNHLKKCSHYLQKKITLILDFVFNFKDIKIHSLSYEYIKHFYYLNSSQFSALRYSKIFSIEIYAGLTSILLGGLYLIWCDANVSTSSIETLVLVFVYVFFIKNFLYDYCHSIQAIENGKGSLEKLKNSLGMLINPDISRVRTIDTRVMFSMSDCKFSWNQSIKFSIEVKKGDIVGICGKNMKALMYSILGHSECKDGILRQRGVIGYFSENPYICVGSVKDNILLGAEFDAKRYYAAISITNLNDDVLQVLGMDEQPIENLDLNLQQRQRIALARAIYSDRDIYLFDEPFKSAVFSSNVVLMFSNVIHSILTDPNKAIVICSSNSHILNMCEKIYDTAENKLYMRADFDRVSAISYHETSVHYTFESIKGCNRDALPIYKAPSRFHVQIIQESSSIHDESTEHLIMRHKNGESITIGIWNIIFITLLSSLNGVIYMLLIIGFIFVVMKNNNDPWLNLFFLGGFVSTFSIELISKIYASKLLEVKLKKLHKIIFEKLLSTTLDALCGINISQIIIWFNVTFYSQFAPIFKMTESAIILLLSSIILILCNFWLTSCVILILSMGQFLTFSFLFKSRVVPSIHHYAFKEYESQKKLIALLINNLRGRDVIQSFERVSEFCREFNFVVEENSMAIFLQKSTKNYASFLLQIIMAANVSILLIVSLLIGEISVYNYLLSTICYYLIMHNANDVLLGYLDYNSTKCKQQCINAEVKNIESVSQVSLLYNQNQLENATKGLMIEFKDVQVKLCGKKLLEINNLHIESNDIVGITGNGAHLITSVLFKLIKPYAGTISIENLDLSLLSQDYLSRLIIAVPNDLEIQNLSISDFINPNNTIAYKKIANKIQEYLPRVLKMTNKTSEKLQQLKREEKQLLCLIKASLSSEKIVIIEFPEKEIQKIINLFITRELYNKTIIIIGTNHRQFELCKRIINLNTNAKGIN